MLLSSITMWGQYVPEAHTRAGCTAGTATEKNKGAGTDAGAANSATVSATINATTDLLTIAAWCFDNGGGTCSFTSVKLGTQTATAWANNASFSDSSLDGKPQLFYIIGPTTTGAQTITLTVSGTHSDAQVSYIDYALGAGCTTFVHDIDSSVGSGTGSTANTPSITATAGDVEYVFTSVSNTVLAVNSPWTAGSLAATSGNEDGYILNASGSATANNMSLSASTAWQAGIMSFKQQ